MATLERPLKEGSVRTYQEKVALGFADILASEADADLDTIYAAWNGGADTVNIADGAVTSAKLAADSVGERELIDNLPGTILGDGSLHGIKLIDNSVHGTKLVDLSVHGVKMVDGGIVGGKLTDGTVAGTKLVPGGSTLVTGTVALPGVVIAANTESYILTLTLPSYRGGLLLWMASLDGNLRYQTSTAETWLYANVLLNGTAQRSAFFRAQMPSASFSNHAVPLSLNLTGFANVAPPAFAHRFDVTIQRAAGDGVWAFERGALNVVGFA
jgi:hypothetical protein